MKQTAFTRMWVEIICLVMLIVCLVMLIFSLSAKAEVPCKEVSKNDLEAIVKKIYSTSKGAFFKRVTYGKFGEALQAPDGTIWSKRFGSFKNGKFNNDGEVLGENGTRITDSDAVRACTLMGGHLPTQQQYTTLMTYFETDSRGYLTTQGREDLYRIFPEMVNQQYWTSSVHPSPDKAYVFSGDGYGLAAAPRDAKTVSVRCVHR